MAAEIPTIEYVRPWLYAKQAQFLFDPARYVVVEASTKTGKTVGCLVWLLEQAMLNGREGRNYWWIAPIYETAGIAFRRLKRYLPREVYEANESKQSLTLKNGATIWFKGADKTDSLYGEDVYAAVIDEATRCKEDAWYAVRSTLTATRGPIRIIGNVKGRKNWAYQMARQAEQGSANMAYYKLTAWDAVEGGVLDRAEVEDAQAKLPDRVFRELYLAEPDDDGGNPFGLAAIAGCVAPLSTAEPVVWGIDLAKSQDWTVNIALDADGTVCRDVEDCRWQGPWEQTIQRTRALVGNTYALVDSTGVGDPVLEQLQKGGGQYEGYKFTAPSKQQLMEGLAVAIQRREVRFPDGVLRQELETFEFEYTRTGVRYCLDPGTRVLTADLQWIPIGRLAVGTKLLAFDEEPVGGRRGWRVSEVTDTGRIVRPCYEMTLDDGTVVVASAEHKWLVDTGPGGIVWRTTEQLREPHATSRSLRFAPSRIVRLLPTWETDESRGGGYLAAAFDGEGSLSQRPRNDRVRGYTFRLAFSQRDNAMAEVVRNELSERGYEWHETRTPSGVLTFGMNGRQAGKLRFLGEIRPRRLLAKFEPSLLIGELYKIATPSVRRMQFVGDREVVAVGTSTKTLIAEGLASHNSAMEGLHDDCVCALALAVHAWRQRSGYAVAPDVSFTRSASPWAM